MRKAVERGESDRKRLANELATYHANDETRVAEVEAMAGKLALGIRRRSGAQPSDD